MKPCKFTFDDGPVFDGFAYGSTWNGFDNVAVTRAECAKIAQWMIESAIDKDAVAEGIHDLMLIPQIDDTNPPLYSLGWGYATQIVRDPPPLPDNAADLIAARFVEVLRAWLTEDEWHAMRIRNMIQDDPLICHSHDFCDANMAMAEAFESVTGHTPDTGTDEVQALWNKAWGIAMPSLGGKHR